MADPAPVRMSSVEAAISLLLSCVCTALNASGRPVCQCAVRHSIQWPSMDGCDCKCANGQGQAWARLQRIEALDGVPNADGSNCGGRVAAYIDVGLYRCVAAFDGNSPMPPTPEQFTSDALGLIHDEYVIRQAVSCCAPPESGVLRGWSWTPKQSLPLGPQGLCAGVVLTVVCQGVPRLTPIAP